MVTSYKWVADNPDRVKKALWNINAHIPVMRVAEKTHKEGFHEVVGEALSHCRPGDGQGA